MPVVFSSSVRRRSYSVIYYDDMASGRWLAVRLDLLTAILIGAVALGEISVSQDAGRCT